jgi:uncharacterized LabA/DUF88 family protein
MPQYHAHAFVDGGYLRELADKLKVGWINPRVLCEGFVYHTQVQRWGQAGTHTEPNIGLTRIGYYDCAPAEGEQDPADVRGYCRAIEVLPDTELGFGMLRGKVRRQKRVDTQMAVDVVVGAFTKAFSVAIIISGDEDHVPAIQEIKRLGIFVVVAGSKEVAGMSPELIRAADRFVEIGGLARRATLITEGGESWPKKEPGSS